MATISRESLIALRARRQAYQIASGFEYGAPIDVSQHCPFCEEVLHVEDAKPTRWVKCRKCGEASQLPPYMLSRIPVAEAQGFSYLPMRLIHIVYETVTTATIVPVLIGVSLFAMFTLFLAWLSR